MLVEDYQNINFDSIPIDTFWNTSEQKESKMHRIHAYPAKFPAFITTKAIEYAEQKGKEIKLVADIFCGCGTSAFEATRNGKDFWGCDINPVATLIAKAKSNTYLDEKVDDYYENILLLNEKINISHEELENVNERIKYWFKDEQIIDLLKLRKSINEVIPKNSKYLNFFLTAFSNILKPTSVWLTKSIKPQVDPNKIPTNVLNAFKIQFNIMKNANIENPVKLKNKVKIDTINFLTKEIDNPFADLIVSSPPYVTSYEYADLHQLSSLWLDYSSDYKKLREGSIGSLYHNTDFLSDIKMLNTTGEKTVMQLFNFDKRKAKSAAKYFVDIQKSVSKSYELLNPGGIALYVIGNTEYKSVRINNAQHLIESMMDSGFKDIEITKRKISKKILTPYRDEKGKFTINKNSRKVYAEEFIVIGSR